MPGKFEWLFDDDVDPADPQHGLTERELDVLAKRRAGLTLKAVGAELGCYPERVRQISDKAQRRLKRSLDAIKGADRAARFAEFISGKGRGVALALAKKWFDERKDFLDVVETPFGSYRLVTPEITRTYGGPKRYVVSPACVFESYDLASLKTLVTEMLDAAQLGSIRNGSQDFSFRP